jgi:hypothetical protein
MEGVGQSAVYSSEIHAAIDRYLRDSWCETADQEVSSVLEKYSNFERYLNEKEVLQLIFAKSGAGSMIFLKAQLVSGRVEVFLKVLGPNPGENYFFKEAVFEENTINTIVATIKEWLEEYQRKIPYQGVVTEVKDDQIVVNIGRKNDVSISDTLEIVRVSTGVIHPLTKEVIDFKLAKIATARIFALSAGDLKGEILKSGDEKVIVGDGVIVLKTANSDFDFPKVARDSVSETVGYTHLKVLLGMGTIDLNLMPTTNTQNKGLFIGGEIDTAIYLSNNVLVGIDVQLNNSNIEYKEVFSSKDYLFGYFYKLRLDYNYFLGDHFLGSRFGVGVGYFGRRYCFFNNDKLGNSYLFGPMVSLNGIVPIATKFSLLINIDLSVMPKYTFRNDLINVSGKNMNYSNYQVSARYLSSKNNFLELSLLYQYAEIRPVNNSKLSFTDLLFSVGITHNF